MRSAAGLVVVRCCGDAVGHALLQQVQRLLVVSDHVLREVWGGGGGEDMKLEEEEELT